MGDGSLLRVRRGARVVPCHRHVHEESTKSSLLKSLQAGPHGSREGDSVAVCRKHDICSWQENVVAK